MVATLVVVLPSSYEGGELIVRHEGEEKSFEFGSADIRPFSIQFAGFYADCEHEVRPLLNGHRLCLIYNLTLASSQAKTSLTAPRTSEHIDSVAESLSKWASNGEVEKLVVTLSHQYTKGSISWETLKGVDRVKANVLCQAAKQAGCRAYLSTLTFWESGSAEYSGRSRRKQYGPRRWGRYDDYDDGDAEDYKMGEIFDSSLTAEGLVDLDGVTLPIGTLFIDEDELLDVNALENVDPEVEFEGYTGNAGMTLEHWYRHAAICIWPEANQFGIICDRDSKLVVPLLKQMVASWKMATGDVAETLKARILSLAYAMISKWNGNEYSKANPEDPSGPDFFESLSALEDPALIGRFLGEIMIADPAVEPGKTVAATLKQHGWKTFRPQLIDVMKATTPNTMERNVRVLESIGEAKPKPKKNDGWSEVCKAVSEELVATIEALDLQETSNDWRIREVDRKAVLGGLVRALVASRQYDLLERVVRHTFDLPEVYELRHVQMPTILEVVPWLKDHLKEPCAAVSLWFSACRTQLESHTAKPPAEPTDYRGPAGLPRTCAHCAELKGFLENPQEAVHRFRMREDLRRHLECEIRDAKCDVDTRTNRSGSPHTLVCTKNKASYLNALKVYHEDQNRLEQMRRRGRRFRIEVLANANAIHSFPRGARKREREIPLSQPCSHFVAEP